MRRLVEVKLDVCRDTCVVEEGAPSVSEIRAWYNTRAK